MCAGRLDFSDSVFQNQNGFAMWLLTGGSSRERISFVLGEVALSFPTFLPFLQNEEGGIWLEKLERLLSHPAIVEVFLDIVPGGRVALVCGGTLSHPTRQPSWRTTRAKVTSFSGLNICVIMAIDSALGEAFEQIAFFQNEDAIARDRVSFTLCQHGKLENLYPKSLYQWRKRSKQLTSCQCKTCSSGNFDDHDVKQSSGLGAGPIRDVALRHGIFELLEHDSLIRWWCGGEVAQSLSPTIIDLSIYADPERKYLFLQLPSPYSVAVVACVSFDQYGQCFCLGSAARASTKDAAVCAIKEARLMEYGQVVIGRKLRSFGWNNLQASEQSEVHKGAIITEDSFADFVASKPIPGRNYCYPSTWKLISKMALEGVDFYVSRFYSLKGEIWVCKVFSRSLNLLSSTSYNQFTTDFDKSMPNRNLTAFEKYRGLLP